MTLKDSQSNMYQHSEVKIRLLKTYLEQYLNILNQSSYIEDIHIFDLFCGEGVYPNGGKGSPIIILETIKNIHYSNVSKNSITGKFNCYFNDIDEDKTQKLVEAIKKRSLHYQEIGALKITNIDYREILPKLQKKLASLKKEKAFIFIDPYGYKDIKLNDLKSLLSCGKSEVLLFLPTQFMFRFETKGTPVSLKDFISELMPAEEWPSSETGVEFIEKLTYSFRKAFEGSTFVDSFIISRDLNQFFCLFFFTNHIYGFDRMLEAKWKLDEEEGRGWHYKQESDLFCQIEKQANTSKYESNLRDFLSIPRTNGQIYRFQLDNGHRSLHTNDILKKFQAEGKLNIFNKDGSVGRKSAFYICYKNYKDEPDKITIKHQ
jgi:three-Cys-motif partner protein